MPHNFPRKPKPFYVQSALVIDFRPPGLPDHWAQTTDLIRDYCDAMRKISHGKLIYQVERHIVMDKFPWFEHGGHYTTDLYQQVLQDPAKAIKGTDGSLAMLDYKTLVELGGLIDQVEKGQADEIWLFGGPYFGFYESRMVGRGSFWCNAPELELPCKRFVIMGYNYERSVKEMVHNFGHRAESMISHHYGESTIAYLNAMYDPARNGGPAPRPAANDFERFLLAHGTCHRAPGGPDYGQDEAAWLSELAPEWWPMVIDAEWRPNAT